MRLFGRAPGAVYRVYGEDEYLESDTQPVELDGRGDSLGSDPRPVAAAPQVSRPQLASFAGPRPAALLLMAMIVAVAVSASVLIMNATTHHPAHVVAAGAQTGRPLSPQRSRRLPAAQPPRARRPRPNRARVQVVRADTHTEVQVDAPPAGARPAPSPAMPTPSSDQLDGGEFGFER